MLFLLLLVASAAAIEAAPPVRIQEGRYYIRLQTTKEMFANHYVTAHLGRRLYLKNAKPDHVWQVFYPDEDSNWFGLRTVAPPTSHEPRYVDQYYIALDGTFHLRITKEADQAASFTAYFAGENGQSTGTFYLKTPLQMYLKQKGTEVQTKAFCKSKWQFTQATWHAPRQVEVDDNSTTLNR